MPKLSGVGTEPKRFYNLKQDMEKLRTDGGAKGIVATAVTDIGRSHKGKELWAIKIGKNSSHPVFIVGCHHAREWISVEVPYLLAEYLITKYKTTPVTSQEKRVKHLVDNREIWIVPMVNPDGHEHSMTSDRMWRTNRRRITVPTLMSFPRYWTKVGGRRDTIAPGPGPGIELETVNVPAGHYFGVDLNRNYPTTTWGQETAHRGRVTTSRDPRDGQVYCGRSAGPELETQRVVSRLSATSFKAVATYHNYSQLILYPDAGRADVRLQRIGKGMEELIREKGNPYTYQSGSALYPTTGDMMDYTYETYTIPVYTLELPPKRSALPSDAFSGLAESKIRPTFNENLSSMLALINCAGFSTVERKVPMKLTPAIKIPFTSKVIQPFTVQVTKNCWKALKGFTP